MTINVLLKREPFLFSVPSCVPEAIDYKKAYQLKANLPLADKCRGYNANRFEQVSGDRGQVGPM